MIFRKFLSQRTVMPYSATPPKPAISRLLKGSRNSSTSRMGRNGWRAPCESTPEISAEFVSAAFEGNLTLISLRASNGQPMTMSVGHGVSIGALPPGTPLGLTFSSADALVLPIRQSA